MITKFSQYSISLGLAGSLAIAIAPAAYSQTTTSSDIVPITGGSAAFSNGLIFVPNNGNVDDRAWVIGKGGNPLVIDNLQITTGQGNIPGSIIFEPALSPTLDTTPGSTPAAGDQGNVAGNVSFVSVVNGTTIPFTNVPAELSFTITSITQTGTPTDSTQFRTDPDFFVATSGAAGNTPTASVITDVFVFQVVPAGDDPGSMGNIPASAFTVDIDGKSHPADFEVDLTGEFITMPSNSGSSSTNSSTNNNSNSSNSNSSNSNSSNNSNSTATTSSEPASNFVNEFKIYEQPGTTTSYVAVGPGSRVFPNLVGVVASNNDADDSDSNTPDDSNSNTPEDSNSNTPDDSNSNPTNNQSSGTSSDQTPDDTSSDQTPDNTTNQTPDNTTNQTPDNTTNQTPDNTTNQTNQ